MKIKQNNTVCLVAGKSAGHILPALTLAQKLKGVKNYQNLIFISNQTALDYTVLSHNPLINKHIAITLMGIPTKKLWLIPMFLLQLIKAFWQSYQTLQKYRPGQIISTGGLIAIPVCLVAKFLKIPVTIYELNFVPGKTTKFLAKFATHIKICFKQTCAFLPNVNCELTNYPTRFSTQDYQMTKPQALALAQLKNKNFEPGIKTILVLGGSQGSLFISDLMRKFVINNKNLNLKLQIIHQTGQNDQFDWSNFYLAHQMPAIIFSYEPNLMPYYIMSDLIVCRSGAGTLAEIIPLNKPCITIPLQTGYADHQLENALAISQEHKQIKTIKQTDITSDFNLFYNIANQSLNF